MKRDLKILLAHASPARSGDELAGVAAESAEARALAQRELADTPLARFVEEPLIPYEADEVTRLIFDAHDDDAFAPIAPLTVGEFREWLLAEETTGEVLSASSPGIMPEMAAAVSKIMRVQDLVTVAAKIRVVTRFRSTIGLEGRLSTRLQPNHPTDDPRGIAASVIDGLLYANGDAVIGVNPANDDVRSVETLLRMLDRMRESLDIPTQICVLAHVTTQMDALRRGAPIDLMFQSITGTEAANRSFGVNLALLDEASQAARELKRGTAWQVTRSPAPQQVTRSPAPQQVTRSPAPQQVTRSPAPQQVTRSPTPQQVTRSPAPQSDNVMYFETGQGSALSANAHHGVDQQTLEARAYAVARRYAPLLVNTVVGFIGPEYLADGKQILRAGLEDHFCGKLLGLPMGCDICYTNHADVDQDDMDTLLTLLGTAGVNYIMGVPGADDIMLNYQSTSFHDALYLRSLLKLRPAPEFEAWLEKMGLSDDGLRLRSPRELPATFQRALASLPPAASS